MRLVFLLGISLLSGVSLAQTECQEKSIFEFYNRLKMRNPIQEQIQKRMKQVDANIDIAKQRPNPEFDLNYLKGNQYGVGINTTAASIQHIFEFGSKRDRRIDEANLSTQIQKKQLALEGLGTNVNFVLKYQRVAQLNLLIKAVKEAVQTFDDAVRRLQTRAALNPEEKVSLSTLRIAASDYRARMNDFENEKTLLEGELFFIAGCRDLKPVYATLGYNAVLNPLKDQPITEDGLIEINALKIRHAEAELEVQRSLGYSNIGIGPSIEYQTEGKDRFVSAGLAVSFAIPFFHTNTGGKMSAYRNVVAQKVESTNAINSLSIKQTRLIEKYRRSVEILSKMASLATLNRQHAEVERLFSRGIVSIPMTIESHRQHIDFLESRFDTENDLLVSLEEIVFIKGNADLLESLFSAAVMDLENKDKK